MKSLLIALFSLVFLSMLWLTGVAIAERSLFEAGPALWRDAWFRATLADAYFGFLTVFVWVAYRETRWTARLAWLVAFLGLGNLAISAYILLQLVRLEPGEGVGSLFRPKRHRFRDPLTQG